ncbi:Somatomedin-B and thrombospondin type-1 domain-containing protein [Schistosoma japonicum]|uniref:Putative spondin 99.0 n=2 Tax=Schistosoma japonicum TaxID=6182 RepID=C1LEZ0_SCHJA|nr:Somatomedin-B and thrombospondin type-1 domain-containing protein [Schistosoma japonicum]TNN07850.1 Somatomedin-B and thrombospondin type-1 domain-containing protein [Schistosoma japonicum]CAX73268.1 putative spondin 99.0 [Schistosoma japonicum]
MIQLIQKQLNIQLNSKYIHWVTLFLFYAAINQITSVISSGCLQPNGMSMCCAGREKKCFVYKSIVQSSISRYYPWKKYRSVAGQSSPRDRCYCDESCVITGDCCHDYHYICQKTKVDCTVSEWGPWTSCEYACGHSVSTRYRQVQIKPSTNGKPCPELNETRPCIGHNCASKRFGRSGTLMLPYIYDIKAEVAHLLPVRGDVLDLTRRYDMRFDVRRKLYLGRLIKMNKTEQPEPDPYCAIYEITYTNEACQTQNLLWQFSSSHDQYPSYYYPNRYKRHNSYNGQSVTFSRNTFLHERRYNLLGNHGMNKNWDNDYSNPESWSTHSGLLTPGQQICVTCYPTYMREDLGYRCTGSGLPNIETRWRALRTFDCQGRFRVVSMPQRSCTCGRGSASFVFV